MPAYESFTTGNHQLSKKVQPPLSAICTRQDLKHGIVLQYDGDQYWTRTLFSIFTANIRLIQCLLQSRDRMTWSLGERVVLDCKLHHYTTRPRQRVGPSLPVSMNFYLMANISFGSEILRMGGFKPVNFQM